MAGMPKVLKKKKKGKKSVTLNWKATSGHKVKLIKTAINRLLE